MRLAGLDADASASRTRFALAGVAVAHRDSEKGVVQALSKTVLSAFQHGALSQQGEQQASNEAPVVEEKHPAHAPPPATSTDEPQAAEGGAAGTPTEEPAQYREEEDFF